MRRRLLDNTIKRTVAGAQLFQPSFVNKQVSNSGITILNNGDGSFTTFGEADTQDKQVVLSSYGFFLFRSRNICIEWWRTKLLSIVKL